MTAMAWPKHTQAALEYDRRVPTETIVYLIADLGANAVKIGLARDVWERLATLRIGNPRPLVVLGVLPGGGELERELHRLFAGSRVGGEWFGYTARLDELVVDAYEAGTGLRYCDRGLRT